MCCMFVGFVLLLCDVRQCCVVKHESDSGRGIMLLLWRISYTYVRSAVVLNR